MGYEIIKLVTCSFEGYSDQFMFSNHKISPFGIKIGDDKNIILTSPLVKEYNKLI